MGNDNRVITLIDQFDKVLDLSGITHNSHWTCPGFVDR
jgi:hypothetical protein